MIVIPMKCSQIAEGYEGLGGRSESGLYLPYHCSADKPGVMTIGRGHVISAADLKSGKFAKGLTLEEVDALYQADMQPRAERLMKIMKDPTEDEFAAALSMFYNLEEAWAPGHTARQLWDAKKKKECAASFLLYRNSAGKPRLGLWRRRGSEALCFLTGKVIVAKEPIAEKLLFDTLSPLCKLPARPTKFY